MKNELNEHQRGILQVIMLYIIDQITKGGHLSEYLVSFGISTIDAKNGITQLSANGMVVPFAKSVTFPTGVRITDITEGRPNDFRESDILTKKGKRLLGDSDMHEIKGMWFRCRK